MSIDGWVGKLDLLELGAATMSLHLAVVYFVYFEGGAPLIDDAISCAIYSFLSPPDFRPVAASAIGFQRQKLQVLLCF